jgi:hypothetical protein
MLEYYSNQKSYENDESPLKDPIKIEGASVDVSPNAVNGFFEFVLNASSKKMQLRTSTSDERQKFVDAFKTAGLKVNGAISMPPPPPPPAAAAVSVTSLPPPPPPPAAPVQKEETPVVAPVEVVAVVAVAAPVEEKKEETPVAAPVEAPAVVAEAAPVEEKKETPVAAPVEAPAVVAEAAPVEEKKETPAADAEAPSVPKPEPPSEQA